MAEKHYIKALCKEIEIKFWSMINISLKPDALKDCKVDAKGYVKLTIMKRKEKGEYWDTHYIVENDYKKENKEEEHKIQEDYTNWDLPF